MKIDIKHLAKLSRLKTTTEDDERFETQMQSIVSMCKNLPEITSEDKLIDKTNPMICRKDVEENNFTRDEILSNAPQLKAGCVVVPKVME